jgi:hypothetical protein
MTTGFDRPSISLKFRDILDLAIEAAINRLRPRSFNAEVISIDNDRMNAMVRTSGNTDPTFDIQVGFTQTLIPAQTRIEGVRSGNQVEISGEPGAYWITKIFSGAWDDLNHV